MRKAPWLLLAPSLVLLALTPRAGAQQAPRPAASASPAAPAPLPAAPAPLPAASASLAAAAPLSPAAQAFPGLAVTRFTLGNGLVVLLQEDHRAPQVWTQVVYRAGGKDDPRNKEGLALTLGNVLTRFTTRHLTGKTLEQIGAQAGRWERSAAAAEDRTVVSVQAPAEGTELALWIQADMMAFHPDAIDQIILDSARQQAQMQQTSATGYLETNLNGLIRTAIYPPTHPYHNRLVGVGESLQGLTRSDLKNFSRTFLVPSNAILAIVGDFDTATIRPLVERYFATILAGSPPVRAPVTPVEPARERTLVIDASVSEPMFRCSWPTPHQLTREDLALDVAARLLLSPTGGRLARRLTDARITGPLSVRQASGQLGSQFQIAGFIRDGHTVAEARAIVDEEITKLGASIDDKELSEARQLMQLELARLLDAPASRISHLSSFAQIDDAPDAAARYWAGYATLTREEVMQTVRRLLTPARRLATDVIPSSAAPRGGQLHEEGL
jgi:predicted Zn-dependent peptidase